MQCPICDKYFESDKTVLSHMEIHKAESFLSKPPPEPLPSVTIPQAKNTPSINKNTLFDADIFEQMIGEKLDNINDIEDLVVKRNFVERVKKIISKYPFVHLQSFLEDFMHGIDSKQILEKYYISDYMALKNLIQKILKFDGDRYTQRQYANAFEMNMKLPHWKDRYSELKNNCIFFQNELDTITFHYILRSFVMLIMPDYIDTGISRQKIVSKTDKLQHNYDIFKFVNDSLAQSFNRYLDADFKSRINSIIDELTTAKILRKKFSREETLVGNLSIDRIKESIVGELKLNNGYISEHLLCSYLKEEHPSLLLLPGFSMIETALAELKDEKIIHIDANQIQSSSITPTIPCRRRHSVAQVMLGDGKDKIVLIKSLNYESGLAIVETVPDRTETTFQIDCLREIDLRITDLDDFETASNTYFDFLCMLASMAPHTFDSGISMNIINVHSKYLDLLRNTNPELFGGPHPEISHVHDESKHDRYVQFEYIHTKINLAKHTNTNSSFKCECNHRLNEEYNYTLCGHLVASINELCVGNTCDWHEINKNINLFKTKLEKFQKENMKRMIDTIYYVLTNDGRSLFKEYLLRSIESD